MKPFNLERALAGEPVITRDGEKITIAGYNANAKKYNQLAGWDSDGAILSWNFDGKFDTGHNSLNDLFMAPTERKEYIVRCVFGNAVWCEGPFPTEDAAIIYAADNNELRSVYEITIIE